jgi:hypothetical protein
MTGTRTGAQPEILKVSDYGKDIETGYESIVLGVVAIIFVHAMLLTQQLSITTVLSTHFTPL